MRDSNPRMVGPEPTALPLGESPSVFLSYHIFQKMNHIFQKSLYKTLNPSYTAIDSLVSDYFLWKEQMANITRIKAGDSKGKTEKTEQPAKIHQETKTTTSKQPTKKLTKLEKAQQKYEKKQLKKQQKLAKKANKKPLPKALRILTAPFRKIGSYIHASWQELRQVRWPNRKMTWKLVSAVVIYTVLFSVVIMLLDAGFTLLFNNLLK